MWVIVAILLVQESLPSPTDAACHTPDGVAMIDSKEKEGYGAVVTSAEF